MARESDLAAAAADADDLPDPRDVVGRDEEVPLEELFSESFVRDHTEFQSLDELVVASPADADSAAELGKVPGGAWDEFVAETTDFDDEGELVFTAMDRWVADQLGL
jgi:hypothetical protein